MLLCIISTLHYCLYWEVSYNLLFNWRAEPTHWHTTIPALPAGYLLLVYLFPELWKLLLFFLYYRNSIHKRLPYCLLFNSWLWIRQLCPWFFLPFLLAVGATCSSWYSKTALSIFTCCGSLRSFVTHLVNLMNCQRYLCWTPHSPLACLCTSFLYRLIDLCIFAVVRQVAYPLPLFWPLPLLSSLLSYFPRQWGQMPPLTRCIGWM